MRTRILLVATIMVLFAISPALAAPGPGGSQSPAGVVLTSEPDALDPMLIWFGVEWEEPAPMSRITVLAPPSMQLVGARDEVWIRAEGDSGSDPVKQVLTLHSVEAGDQSRFMADFRDVEPGQPAMVLAERVIGRTTYQTIVRVEMVDRGVSVAAPASYRLTDVPRHSHQRSLRLESTDGRPVTDRQGGGTVVVESLDPKIGTQAEIFQQDTVNMGIADGPYNCADSNPQWPIVRDLYINTAPVGSIITALTIHVSITHPSTYDLQMGYFYGTGSGPDYDSYLWRNGAGTNIDRDFTQTYYSQTLPGVGLPVNENYRVAVRDCYAADEGTFNYWSIRVEYSGGGGSCTYSISPSSVSLPSGGGSGSVVVTSGPGCTWTASANASWIAVTSGASGSGNGSVAYSVGANSGGARSGTVTIAGQTFTISQSGSGGGGTCTPNATTLCLNNGRFQVQANWATSQPSSGVGQGVSLTDDTGYFWFFNQNNVEMVVKVLSGCGVNGNYWVFAGGLTNVQVSMTVTDTSNGTTKSYNNPQGTPFQPVQDTGAFATCP